MHHPGAARVVRPKAGRVQADRGWRDALPGLRGRAEPTQRGLACRARHGPPLPRRRGLAFELSTAWRPASSRDHVLDGPVEQRSRPAFHPGGAALASARRSRALMVFENLYGGIAPGKTTRRTWRRPSPSRPRRKWSRPSPSRQRVAPIPRRPQATGSPAGRRRWSAASVPWRPARASTSRATRTCRRRPWCRLCRHLPLPHAKPEPRPAPKAVAAAATKPTAVAAGPKPSASSLPSSQDGDGRSGYRGRRALLPQDDGFGDLTPDRRQASTGPGPEASIRASGGRAGALRRHRLRAEPAKRGAADRDPAVPGRNQGRHVHAPAPLASSTAP